MRNDKNKLTEGNEMRFNEYHEILDKLIKLNSEKHENRSLKIIFSIFGGIIATILTIFICLKIYQNDFTVESLLSVLLAFFSMFIAIFFYFKADEANSRFYDSSYSFMKDVSVTLGKIEERFGEKLNSMNEKLNHIESVKQETTEELKTTENEKDTLINELLEKANMTEEERDQYRKDLEEKEHEAEMLKAKLMRIEMENRNLSNISEIELNNSSYMRFINELSEYDLERLLSQGRMIDVDSRLIKYGINCGVLDHTGHLTKTGHNRLIHLLKNKKNIG